MAKEYTVTANNNPRVFRDVGIKGGAKTYQIDFSAWADDNNDLSTVTWSLESGSASISSISLSSNIASALVTFSDVGRSLIKILADSGTEIYVAYIDVVVKDPTYEYVDDYGLC